MYTHILCCIHWESKSNNTHRHTSNNTPITRSTPRPGFLMQSLRTVNSRGFLRACKLLLHPKNVSKAKQAWVTDQWLAQYVEAITANPKQITKPNPKQNKKPNWKLINLVCISCIEDTGQTITSKTRHAQKNTDHHNGLGQKSPWNGSWDILTVTSWLTDSSVCNNLVHKQKFLAKFCFQLWTANWLTKTSAVFTRIMKELKSWTEIPL